MLGLRGRTWQAAFLPKAPNEAERVLYVKRRVWWLLPLVVFAFGGISYGFVRVCLITGWFDVFLAYWAFACASFALAVPVNYLARDFDLARHDALVAGWRPLRYPSLDIWLPNCGEALEILRNTWNHVAALDYPGTLTVYCLDDVGLSAVSDMAQEFGFVYLSRPEKGWMKKSGNLRYAYQHSSGEVIALFDADFCPRPDFLLELMPYIDLELKVAIVQSAQYFRVDREQNWIERGAAQVQEFFYRTCQVSRAAKCGAICCGTNALYRRAALDQNGGMTLVPQGEDMRTGFDLERRGWLLSYVPLNLAMGLSPCDMSSYFKQQYRWCTGSLRLLSEPLFWESNLPNKAKLCYLAGFNYYIQSALYLFVLPSLIISLLVFFPQHFNIADYAVILPAIAVMTVAYPLWHRCRFGPAAWSIRVVQQWTYVFAIFDFIREATIPWDATGSTVRSVASTRRYSQFKFAVVGWNGLITIAWGGLAVWRMAAGDWVSFVFVAAMGCYWVAVTYRVIFSLRSAR
jgi:cellulose synthase (UDP-forming)